MQSLHLGYLQKIPHTPGHDPHWIRSERKEEHGKEPARGTKGTNGEQEKSRLVGGTNLTRG